MEYKVRKYDVNGGFVFAYYTSYFWRRKNVFLTELCMECDINMYI